jgi:hypothetical protein
LDATADTHAAYIRRDSLSPKEKKVVVKKAHALEKAFHDSESLLDLVAELVDAPKDVPSIKEALEGYPVVKGEKEEVDDLKTHAPGSLRFVEAYE